MFLNCYFLKLLLYFKGRPCHLPQIFAKRFRKNMFWATCFLSVLLEINTEGLFVDLSSLNIQNRAALARNCIPVAKATLSPAPPPAPPPNKKEKGIETENQKGMRSRNKITMEKKKPFYICFELSGNVSCSIYYKRSESLFSNSSMNCGGHAKKTNCI